MHRLVLLLPALALSACQEPWPEPEASPAPSLRRLTQTQYENAARDLFGDDVFVPTDIEPDLRIKGLQALGTTAASISPRGVERYEDAAYALAEQAMEPERRETLMPCTPSGVSDEACARAFFEGFGRRAWRRPLTGDELDTLVAISDNAASTLADFHDGLEFGIATVLQSPEYLMRVELGAPGDGGHAYTDWEMASRLSFLFWNSIPDDELLDAAEAGELTTADGIDAQALRLLQSPRARQGLRAWITDMLQLDELDDLKKDPETFVNLTDGLFASAREETLSTVEHIVFETDEDFRNLLTTRTTFLDRTLATLYGVRAPAREGFAQVELTEADNRMGLLTHASVLALHSHATSTSPTLRGKFLRETLLCEVLPPPPGNVDTSIPEPSEAAPTLRDRVKAHQNVPACASCHKTMDDPALSLENYDGLGMYRTTENGVTIDATGELDGVMLDGAGDLAMAVRDHEHFVPCMVEQIVRQALGRDPAETEEASYGALIERFRDRDHRMQPLLLDFVTHPMFRKVGEIQ